MHNTLCEIKPYVGNPLNHAVKRHRLTIFDAINVGTATMPSAIQGKNASFGLSFT